MYQDVALFYIYLYQETETKDMDYILMAVFQPLYKYLIEGKNIMASCINLPLFLVFFFNLWVNVLLLKKVQFSLTCNK